MTQRFSAAASGAVLVTALVAVGGVGAERAHGASPSPSPSADCPDFTITTSPRTITSGDTFRVSVIVRAGTHLVVQRVPGETVREVAASPEGGQTWDFRLGENHTLDVSVGDRCGRPAHRIAVAVRPVVSIQARRDAARTYEFSGRVMPAAAQRATLWRVDEAGRRTLAATSEVTTDGTYTLRKVFTGSGRFGFQVDVAGSAKAQAGRSPVRSTVIH